MEELIIVKVGGSVINEEQELNDFLDVFVSLKGKKVLVHGGGKIATEVGKLMGIESKFHEGRRITDLDTMRLVTMVYAGLVNKTIVSKLQSKTSNGVGLTGADGNLILSEMRKKDGVVDYGYVGDITQINTRYLMDMLENDMVPVIAPITHDGAGNVLNTNADTIASEVAIALSVHYEVVLNYCFELGGVLKDINDPASVIEKLGYLEYLDLHNGGVISAGMIPKMDNCYKAIQAGVKNIYICNAKDLKSIINDKKPKGTLLYND